MQSTLTDLLICPSLLRVNRILLADARDYELDHSLLVDVYLFRLTYNACWTSFENEKYQPSRGAFYLKYESIINLGKAEFHLSLHSDQEYPRCCFDYLLMFLEIINSLNNYRLWIDKITFVFLTILIASTAVQVNVVVSVYFVISLESGSGNTTMNCIKTALKQLVCTER